MIAIVAVRATHPTNTFGWEKEKSEGPSEDELLLLDDEPVDGGFCFTKCRRSSRAR